MPSFAEVVSALSPSLADLVTTLAILALALGLSGIGAVLAGRDRVPEADLPVGWAVVSFVFIVGGGVLRLPLSVLAMGVAAVGVAALLVLTLRRRFPIEPGLARMLVLLVPFVIVVLTAQPSQWDEFAQWLPNARYLTVMDSFPWPDLPPSDSVFAAYPYALPLVNYLAGLIAGQTVDNAAPLFNLLLLAGFGRVLVRLFRGDDLVSWPAAVAGMLAVTALSPTFVPKLVLSSYADTATAVAIGLSAVLGLKAVEALESGDRRAARSRMIQFGLVYALLPMTKQGNYAVMALLPLSLALVTLRFHDWRRIAVPAWGLTFVPAAVAALAWRWYVAAADASKGEMLVRALSDWAWALLPQTLDSMLSVAMSKSGFFGLGLVFTGLGLWALGKKAARPEDRMVVIFATVFLAYNLFLLFVYVAILEGYETARAASFWRYNTHLGLLELAAAGALAGTFWRRHPLPDRIAHGLAALGTVIAVAGPVAGAKFLRFDLQPVKVHVRSIAPEIGAMLEPGDRLMVIDPNGSGFYRHFLDYHLGFGKQVVSDVSVFRRDILDRMAEAKPTKLWIHTQRAEVTGLLGLDLPEAASHLLTLTPTGWQLVRSWPFPGYTDPSSIKE